MISISFWALFVCYEASAFLAAANGLPFATDHFSRIRASGEWQSQARAKMQ
jgi:hypothetical protein